VFERLSSWFARSQKRRDDLAPGVDADLVRANWWRYRAALICFAVFWLLMPIQILVRPIQWLDLTVRALMLGLFVASIVLGRWAQVEHAELTRPEPEEPPSMFKR
jgi:hypothetical protein